MAGHVADPMEGVTTASGGTATVALQDDEEPSPEFLAALDEIDPPPEKRARDESDAKKKDDENRIDMIFAAAGINAVRNSSNETELPRRYFDLPENALPRQAFELIYQRATASRQNPKSPPALRAPSDVWRIMSAHLCTPCLKSLSQTCSALFAVMRGILSKRLAEHSLMTDPSHLMPEQREAYDLAVRDRKSIFITGEGGSGKSVVFRSVVSGLRQLKVTVKRKAFNQPGRPPVEVDSDAEECEWYTRNLVVAVAAPTGTAAEVCGGVTLAALFGQFPDNKQYPDSYKTYPLQAYNGGNIKMLQTMDVLAIDEISMVSVQNFEMMSGKLKQLRHDSRPFGGVQLICCGDFAQLPPVCTAKPEEKYPLMRNRCFMSEEWRNVFGDPYDAKEPRMVVLPTSVRQSRSQVLLREALSSLRRFEAPPIVTELLSNRHFDVLKAKDDPILKLPSIILGSDNKFVDEINQRQLKRLIEAEKQPWAIYTSWFNRDPGGNRKPDPDVKLAVGARVSLARNALNYRLTNGSLGKIVRFVTIQDSLEKLLKCQVHSPHRTKRPSGSPQPKEDQRPLYWLSNAQLDVRAKTGKLLSPQWLLTARGPDKYPVVVFDSQPDNEFLVSLWSTPVSISEEEEKQNGSLTKYHLPLRVAYASTLHRVQGMTVTDVVRLNLAGCFAPEQIYVAFSRVRSVEQIVVVKPFGPQRLYGAANADKLICKATLKLMTVFDLRLKMRKLEDEIRQREIIDLEKGIAPKNPSAMAISVRHYHERCKPTKVKTAESCEPSVPSPVTNKADEKPAVPTGAKRPRPEVVTTEPKVSKSSAPPSPSVAKPPVVQKVAPKAAAGTEKPKDKCVICFANPHSAYLPNCSHANMCYDCASKQHAAHRTCPTCRAPITSVARMFR